LGEDKFGGWRFEFGVWEAVFAFQQRGGKRQGIPASAKGWLRIANAPSYYVEVRVDLTIGITFK
jgi:hypothetical protein